MCEFLKVLLLVSNLNSIKRTPVIEHVPIFEIQEFGFCEIYHLDPNISFFASKIRLLTNYK